MPWQVLSFSPSNSSGARLHAKRSLECIHSSQTHPEEDQRWTRESDTELEPAAGAFRPLPFLPSPKRSWSPLPISAGASGPRLCPRGGYTSCFGRSAAGAGGGGEDDDAWKTQRSGRSWMARPGPGDPRPAPQAGSRRAGLRSSAWARQRAPGGGGGGGAGTGEPG
ncbi:ubiquitin-related modifier 1 isoform X3 [Herpailurus yagouaroundi]|uniref:ubiquitin-related modifier 1 isoform X3 n=1 Tax=Herpailurus yagouaroundi TaxID=1608482 RepID=UPI001AD712B5|nr:ubiquitin-related modifier 1 isoform X3 [Puma yagouaroundi]